MKKVMTDSLLLSLSPQLYPDLKQMAMPDQGCRLKSNT